MHISDYCGELYAHNLDVAPEIHATINYNLKALSQLNNTVLNSSDRTEYEALCLLDSKTKNQGAVVSEAVVEVQSTVEGIELDIVGWSINDCNATADLKSLYTRSNKLYYKYFND